MYIEETYAALRCPGRWPLKAVDTETINKSWPDLARGRRGERFGTGCSFERRPISLARG